MKASKEILPGTVVATGEVTQPDAGLFTKEEVESAVALAVVSARQDLHSELESTAKEERQRDNLRFEEQITDLKSRLSTAEASALAASQKPSTDLPNEGQDASLLQSQIEELQAANKSKDGTIEELTRKLTLFSRKKPSGAAAPVVPTPTVPPTAVSSHVQTQNSDIKPPVHEPSSQLPPSVKTEVVTQSADDPPTTEPQNSEVSSDHPPTSTGPKAPQQSLGVPRGRGRGTAVRGRGNLGGGMGSRGRGISGAASTTAGSSNSTGGVSIAGAAKRPLDDSDQAGGELAKRLRPNTQRNRQPPGGTT